MKRILHTFFVLIAMMVLFPMTIFAANDSKSEEKYLDYVVEKLTTTDAGGQAYMGTFVELSGGKIIKENENYYLVVDYSWQTYNTSKKTGKSTTPKNDITGCLNVEYNNKNYDLLNYEDYELKENIASESATKYFYDIVKEVKIKLDDVSDYSQIKGKKLIITYQKSSTSAN